MSRYRRLIATVGVIALLLLSFGTAAAKDDDTPKPPHGRMGHAPAGKGKPAHLTWSPGRLTQAVAAGQILRVTATFTSSTDITEATLLIPGGLGKVMKADSAKLTNIKAGAVTKVSFTVTMPAQGAHTQGGVVLIRAGQRVLAQPLRVLLTVGKSTDTDENDMAKPVKPAKPAKPTKPAHR